MHESNGWLTLNKKTVIRQFAFDGFFLFPSTHLRHRLRHPSHHRPLSPTLHPRSDSKPSFFTFPSPSSPRTSRSLPSPLSTPETKKTMESYSKKKSRKELGWSSSNLTIFLVILCILYPMYSKSIKQSRIWFRHKNSESNSQGYLLLSLFEIQVTELS